MVDVAVMLGAPEAAARVQMEKALAFETKLAHVQMFPLKPSCRCVELNEI